MQTLIRLVAVLLLVGAAVLFSFTDADVRDVLALGFLGLGVFAAVELLPT